MHLFYIPRVNANSLVLPEEESRHCVRVLRLAAGDTLSLVDGRGGWYRCRVTRADAKQCEVTCIEKIEGHGRREFSIHVAIAPTKNIERLEWCLEKCTEIGIDEITPLLCDRSERKVIHPERLEKILVAAMKQSLKAYLPVLHPLTACREFLRDHRDTLKCIAHCDAGERYSLHQRYIPGTNITLLVGPEGDFSPDEIRLALANGFLPVTLGESRLRTETAGIVACHTVHLLNALGS
ncbi:MAG: 16S rRNA (uracil(1498)-N(3))-methyltransferase [Odoribacteraceae bacterium]|jgi:16S rRNA (uracil1498-N3)-methyltransferase|nr:16S rRNA (uracil(1498)-N(3))-methyltransferase [Odoribacteraceae bacterium]